MELLSLENVTYDGEYIHLEAYVDDAVIVYSQTYFDPPEYGPALCEGKIYVPDYENQPLTEDVVKQLIESSCIDWRPIDTSCED
jgi:hypothetical protein